MKYQNSLTAKFIIPLILGVLVTLSVGNMFLIMEFQRSSDEQRDQALSALNTEKESATTAQMAALESKADAIGRFMAKTAADFIVSYDFTALQVFQEEAAKDPEVSYSAYLKPDGSNMTQYKLPQGLDDILEKRYPIILDGDNLGFVLLGMTRKGVKSNIENSVNRIKSAVDKVNKSTDESLQRFYTIIFMAIVLVLVIITTINYALFKMHIIRPLAITTRHISNLAQGDGDLTVNIPSRSKDEIGQLGLVVNAFVTKLADMIRIIKHEVDQLSLHAEKMNGFSHDLSSNSDQQREQTNMVASSMLEMTVSLDEVAKNITGAAVSTEQGQVEASNGRNTVDTAIKNIHTLSGEVITANEAITTLKANSHEISEVINVINDIAEQTNLLALNAAIEAARAGEQGRGFAVVADEVRALATRTHQSIQQIQDMIAGVQSNIDTASNVMVKSQTTAKGMVIAVEHAGDSLQSIIEQSNIVNDMTTQIASSTEEQSITMRDLARNVEEIRQISDDTADKAMSAANSSKEQSAMAIRLQTLVSQFRTE